MMKPYALIALLCLTLSTPFAVAEEHASGMMSQEMQSKMEDMQKNLHAYRYDGKMYEDDARKDAR